MGTTTTTYDVVTRYMLRDEASRGTHQLTQHVQGLERSAASAGGMFGRLGTMVAGYVGFQQGKRHLIEYNSTMEQSRIQMAGLMAQAGSGDFVANLDKASTLMRQMRDDAAKTVGTTQDYVMMASQLVQPLTMAGGQLSDIREMTRLSVVGTKAMGIDAIVGARDIDQAIRGMYRSVDQFTGKLLTPMGYGGEEGRKKFNALTMQERFAKVKESLKSKAIEDMARAQENTFEGQYSTFESIAKQTMGVLGLPLFKGITAQLKEWNTWLQNNEKKVENIAEIIGKKLVQAAVSFKDAIAWAAMNWDKIAMAYAGLKAAGFLASGSNAGGLLGAAGGAAGMPGKFGGSVASVSLVASAVYIGGTLLADFINDRHEARITRSAATGSGTMEAVLTAAAGLRSPDFGSAAKDSRILRQQLTSSGLASEQGGLNREGFIQAMKESGASASRWAGVLGIKGTGGLGSNGYTLEQIANAIASAFDNSVMKWNMVGDIKPWRMEGMRDSPLTKPEKPKVNVTVQRIEVASEDPDRFVFRMVNAFRGAAKNPSGIGAQLYALREG